MHRIIFSLQAWYIQQKLTYSSSIHTLPSFRQHTADRAPPGGQTGRTPGSLLTRTQSDTTKMEMRPSSNVFTSPQMVGGASLHLAASEPQSRSVHVQKPLIQRLQCKSTFKASQFERLAPHKWLFPTTTQPFLYYTTNFSTPARPQQQYRTICAHEAKLYNIYKTHKHRHAHPTLSFSLRRPWDHLTLSRRHSLPHEQKYTQKK